MKEVIIYEDPASIEEWLEDENGNTSDEDVLTYERHLTAKMKEAFPEFEITIIFKMSPRHFAASGVDIATEDKMIEAGGILDNAYESILDEMGRDWNWLSCA